MDVGINRFYVQPFIISFTKTLRITIGENAFIIAQNSNFISIPFGADAYIIVRAIKMPVLKQKTVYLFFVLPFFHLLINFIMVLLMQHFIRLYVKTPVCII